MCTFSRIARRRTATAKSASAFVMHIGGWMRNVCSTINNSSQITIVSPHHKRACCYMCRTFRGLCVCVCVRVCVLGTPSCKTRTERDAVRKPRNHVSYLEPLDGKQIGATWRIRLNDPCTTGMRPHATLSQLESQFEIITT